MKCNFLRITISWLSIILILTIAWANAQLLGTERRYVRVGPLQSYFSSFGRERAFNGSYYEGLIWPADYDLQDNAVINCIWLGCKDFIDEDGKAFERYSFAISVDDNVGYVLFPTVLKQTAKFPMPTVYVDGSNVTARYNEDVDEIDPDQLADRIITNTVNTRMGLTMTRTIYYFTQQYHNNYFLKVFTFTNTGNTDWDDEIELRRPLKGVAVSTGVRYAVCREGSQNIGGTQSWGQHSWVTKRGENYAANANKTLTEADGPVDWLRCGFAWAGQAKDNNWDNIGGPKVKGDGRLTAPHHAGSVIIHVDKSPKDRSDDPSQPTVLGWHAADLQTFFSTGFLQEKDLPNIIKLYEMITGVPLQGRGGNERFDEKFMATNPDPFTVHNDAGGTHIWVCYGPWDLEPGESITIVEAEAVAGLSREMCETIGRRWKMAYSDPADKGPFPLPDGSTTTDKDEYKNKWVYTGKDSILLSFSRAKRNYEGGMKIPQPPQPPPLVNVTSGGDRITISWEASPSEADADFVGYKIYRAVGKTDTFYTEIYSGGKTPRTFDDVTAVRGFSYYYYVVAYNDGSNNISGIFNPRGPLMSSKFYTRTTEPAYLRRQAGQSLSDIRIVPNPYNIKARDLQYTGEPDKIMFLNIPGQCIIRIFTERGDLIHTIHHTNGSGDESWNSITSSRQVVVSGIYLVHVEVTQDHKDPLTGNILYRKGDSAIRKMVIIR